MRDILCICECAAVICSQGFADLCAQRCNCFIIWIIHSCMRSIVTPSTQAPVQQQEIVWRCSRPVRVVKVRCVPVKPMYTYSVLTSAAAASSRRCPTCSLSNVPPTATRPKLKGLSFAAATFSSGGSCAGRMLTAFSMLCRSVIFQARGARRHMCNHCQRACRCFALMSSHVPNGCPINTNWISGHQESLVGFHLMG